MENRPERTGENGRTVESVLQTVTQDLKRLHQDVITQLAQEVRELQTEKSRLAEEVQALRSQSQTLQTQNQHALSQQQIAQQQIWAKQLALHLSNHLQGLMMQQIEQAIQVKERQWGGGNLASGNVHSDNANRLLASLDATFNSTFQSLQQELNSYQSSLSQQLSRMHSLEQQGEAILEALVARLREQLQAHAASTSSLSGTPNAMLMPPLTDADIMNQTEAGRSPSLSELQGVPTQAQPNPNFQPYTRQPGNTAYPPSGQSDRQPNTNSLPLAVPGVSAAKPAAEPKKENANFWLGLTLVLISTVALSIHNVVVKIIGTPSSILGSPKIGGFINLGTLGNSLLILWLRMLVVLPLMVVLAMVLYPPVWRDLKRFFQSKDWKPIFNVVGSGFFLFLSQILIYIAISKIGPGPAVTILFMYPIVTVPLAWVLFGDRPTWLRWTVMGVISFGVILTALPGIMASKTGLSLDGFLIAAVSGVAFALYLVLMQLGFKRLHPVPVSLIQFFTIFVLSSVILIILGPNLGVNVVADQRAGFIFSGIILGALTLVGYLTNNFGVRFMGAGLASIIASIGPAMTALLAWAIIGIALQGTQIWGILLVTLGVGALSFERMTLQKRPPKQTSKQT